MKNQSVKPGVVSTMREIRENVSISIMNMSLEEEKTYIKNELMKLKNKSRSVLIGKTTKA